MSVSKPHSELIEGPFVVTGPWGHAVGFPKTWTVEVTGVMTLADCPREDVAHLIAQRLNEWPGLLEQLEALQDRKAEAEGIIHTAIVTNSDPVVALRDAMDALGGDSIPIATASIPASEPKTKKEKLDANAAEVAEWPAYLRTSK